MGVPSELRCVILESQLLLRDFLELALSRCPGTKLCGSASYSGDAEMLCWASRPDILICGRSTSKGTHFPMLTRLWRMLPGLRVLLVKNCTSRKGDVLFDRRISEIRMENGRISVLQDFINAEQARNEADRVLLEVAPMHSRRAVFEPALKGLNEAEAIPHSGRSSSSASIQRSHFIGASPVSVGRSFIGESEALGFFDYIDAMRGGCSQCEPPISPTHEIV